MDNAGTIKLLIWRRTIDSNQFELVSMVTLDTNDQDELTFMTSDYSVPYDTQQGDILGLWLENGAGITYDASATCNEGEGQVYVLSNVRPDDLVLGKTYTSVAKTGATACRNYSIETTVIQRK